jgi:hypothetical protein
MRWTALTGAAAALLLAGCESTYYVADFGPGYSYYDGPYSVWDDGYVAPYGYWGGGPAYYPGWRGAHGRYHGHYHGHYVRPHH